MEDSGLMDHVFLARCTFIAYLGKRWHRAMDALWEECMPEETVWMHARGEWSARKPLVLAVTYHVPPAVKCTLPHCRKCF